jgi:diguanylate cyclase (GGDEF)-like protein/PAS domain S-box-containing protein
MMSARPDTQLRRTPLLLLVAVLTGACIAVAGTMFGVFYVVSLDGQKARLVDAVRAEASAIRHLAEHERDDPHGTDLRADTVARVVDSARGFPGFGETGEFTFGGREGETIVFYLRNRHHGVGHTPSAGWDSGHGSPMRAALEGRSGVEIGYDYRGIEVLAAFEPITEFGFGLVAKIDMAELRRPFLMAAAAAAGVGALVVAFGSFLFFRIGTPMLRQLDFSERRYRELFEHMRSPMLVLRAMEGCRDFIITDANDALTTTDGRRPEDVVGRRFSALFPGAGDSLNQAMLRVHAEGTVEHLPHIYYEDDRVAGWREHTLFRLPSGEVVNLFEDVTARKAAEAGLQMAHAVFQHTGEGIVVTTPEGVILRVNPAFTEITGYAAEEALGRTPSILKSDHQDAKFYQEMWRVLLEEGAWQGEIWNRRKNGEAYLEWLTVNAVRNDDGSVAYYIAVFDDISELHAKELHIRHQAFHDALTGLPNRSLLIDRLEHALEAAGREDRGVAVLFVDLDRFKVINDSLGHDVGDEFLKAFTTRMKSAMRRADTLARLGGDEFVILVTDFTTPADVAVMADKLFELLAQPFILAGHEVHGSASIGIALYPADGSDARTLMKNADTAMYAVKEGGRSGYRFFDASMNAQAIERLTLESALRRAIERDEFELHYQPKVTLADSRLSGMEALVRWRHPTQGMVPPDRFIPLAEETGLVVPLGEWVLRTACRQARTWRQAGYEPGAIAVNVSARQLAQPDFAQRVAAILAEEQVPCRSIELEITETAIMRDPAAAATMLAELEAMGLRIALDDFGIGYSSLGHLKRLPISVLKIDRSFISDVTEDPESAALARAIVELAGALAIEVVAEGVETEAQAAFLTGCGCGKAQGWLFAKAQPADDLAARFLRSPAVSAAP